MEWDNPENHHYRDGDFYLGTHKGFDIGVRSERHAITIAGAGSGKGATCIIPNIKRWPHNLLVIDPKGENAKETIQDRTRKGQNVYVLDPFMRTGVDEKYIAKFNPLSALDVNSLTIAEDIKAIADGIVMRGHDPSAENWDDGAVMLISGVIAYVLLEGDDKNLGEVRDIISDRELVFGFAETCKSDTRLGGLMRSGAGRILAQEGMYYISNADKNTAWLDSQPVRDCLASSNFDLSEIKNGKASIYLCLPANYVASHGRFLRMFVRCAIEEMARQTPDKRDKGEQCLFMLDEFFALGYIKEIAVSSGLMRGYGLQLWPVLQDLGQLIGLYGREGAETFFANADVHQFFGVSDLLTAERVSNQLGRVGDKELPKAPEMPHMVQPSSGMNLGGVVSGLGAQSKDSNMRLMGSLLGGSMSAASGLKASLNQMENQYKQEQYQNEMNEYQRAMSTANMPRVPPDEVVKLTQKTDNGIVAEKSINIVKGKAFLLTPQPYFQSGGTVDFKYTWLDWFDDLEGKFIEIPLWLILAIGGFMITIANKDGVGNVTPLGAVIMGCMLAGFPALGYYKIKDRLWIHTHDKKWITRPLKILGIFLVIEFSLLAFIGVGIGDYMGWYYRGG